MFCRKKVRQKEYLVASGMNLYGVIPGRVFKRCVRGTHPTFFLNPKLETRNLKGYPIWLRKVAQNFQKATPLSIFFIAFRNMQNRVFDAFELRPYPPHGVNSGRGATFSPGNEDFFLKSCFWYFPSECNASKRNQQFGLNQEGIFPLDCQ